MKRIAVNFSLIALAAFLSLPSLAQDDKDKEKEKKKGAEQIIITKKSDDNEKIVIEINGDKITINGKSADEYKDGEIKVNRNKIKTYEGLNTYSYTYPNSGNESFNFNWNDNNGSHTFTTMDDNRAMLGVVTEETDQGAKVTDITEESAAKKAGIKEGDIITKIDDTKVETPDDLSKAVRKHKPGEKVTVTLLRDKKEQKITAELGKWKGVNMVTAMPKMRMMEPMPPRSPYYGQSLYSSGNSPKLGLSVQDTDDGKGVKVIDVDDESNAAKAGVKEDDIITHINEKAVNSTDEVVKIVKENKDKPSIQLKVKRGGKVQNIVVKMPRKLKTTDL